MNLTAESLIRRLRNMVYALPPQDRIPIIHVLDKLVTVLREDQ